MFFCSIRMHIPEGLVPDKQENAKTPSQSSIDKVVGELKTSEELKALQSEQLNKDTER